MRLSNLGACLAVALSVTLAVICAGASTPAAAAASSTANVSATSPATPAAPAELRDFLFQINGYQTKNQGGQTLDMYFHYRYNPGLPDAQLPNYEDLRTQALTFFANINTASNPYWEVLNSQLCRQLHDHFPIQAISCQLLVHPDDRPGLPYEPGYHSSIDTIGDITPLAVTGNTGP